MTGNDESKKTSKKEDVAAEESQGSAPGSAGAAPKVRHPRDTSGELIAVDVEPSAQSEAAADAGAADEAGAPEAEALPEVEVDPVAELEAQLDKKQNQLLRVAADYDNYKKRSRRDATEAAFRARNELLQELLPTIDNVELALTHSVKGSEGESDTKALRAGVEMVLRQFQTTMEKHEVKAFDSLGKPFDPNFHEALSQRETAEHPPGVVVEEYRRGYMMGDRLIRPAMVVVAAAPAVDKTSDDGGDVNDDTAADKASEK